MKLGLLHKPLNLDERNQHINHVQVFSATKHQPHPPVMSWPLSKALTAKHHPFATAMLLRFHWLRDIQSSQHIVLVLSAVGSPSHQNRYPSLWLLDLDPPCFTVETA